MKVGDVVRDYESETRIWVTNQFEGFHSWPDAPDDREFLRSVHRHLFHVKLTLRVAHDDRQVEFFDAKECLEGLIASWFKGKTHTYSCEQIARKLAHAAHHDGHDVVSCEVSEDGENGAIYEFVRTK